MAYETVADAVIEVAQNMSLVNGEGMTPYSDSLIKSQLAQANMMICGVQTWSENLASYIRTLDGTTGRITVGIPNTEVRDPKKIYRVYHESSPRPLPRVSGYMNQLIERATFGYSLIAPALDPGPQKQLIQFLPLTLTGQVQFLANLQYDFTNNDLVVPISFWAHVWWASWMYASSDATNPAQIEAFKDNYNNALSIAQEEENARPMAMNAFGYTVDQWYASDDPYGNGGA